MTLVSGRSTILTGMLAAEVEPPVTLMLTYSVPSKFISGEATLSSSGPPELAVDVLKISQPIDNLYKYLNLI
jgi:hypothetical protein